MPVLSPNKPHRTREPQLLIENELAPGTHRFSLVVVDDSGNESAPATISVTVRRPRPVLDPDIIRERVVTRGGGVVIPEPEPEPEPLRPITPIIRPRRPN